jgi:hypothetical protein
VAAVLLSWVVFPLVLALVGAGWGLACRALLGIPLDGALVVPYGLVLVILAGGLLTAWPVLAPATVTVVAVVAVVGLVWHVARTRRKSRLDRWAVAVGVLVLLAFGAPVILSGSATFLGYIRLDDTATWLGIVDRVTSHGRSLTGLPTSSYALILHEYVRNYGYPLGSFLLLGVGRALVGVDGAWVFQPYLSFCAAMVGLVLYAMLRPVVRTDWLRALVAAVAAQSALLYGYASWGAIKELTAAFTLVLLAAMAVRVPVSGPERRRGVVGVGVAAAGMAVVLGPGAVAWVGPAFVVLVGRWVSQARSGGSGERRAAVLDVGILGGVTAVLMVPVWIELSAYLTGSTPLFSPELAPQHGLGNLLHPLSAFQLAGIWPVGDFRTTAPAVAVVPLLLALAGGVGYAVFWAVRQRRLAILGYTAVAIAGCLVVWAGGGSPWVIAKALAIASPALPALGLVGAAMLWRANRVAGAMLAVVIAGGVLWSNVLAYHDVTLAPRARLAELQQIAPLLNGHDPTLVNEYDPYATRHFLRNGAPIEPAEYRPFDVPLSDGRLLTQAGFADLDAFAARTLLAYPSIVTRVSPVASRPPSLYRLRWQGRYYQLWQRPLHPTRAVLEHVSFGDALIHPYCGSSTTGYSPLCPKQPVATAPCSLVNRLARTASTHQADLVAYQRPAPIVALADQTQWPGSWIHDRVGRTLRPTTSGTLLAHIRLAVRQRYEVWLGGYFMRGFEVSVDGHALGRVKDQLQSWGQYASAGELMLGPGVHTIALQYPSADLTPGSGADLNKLTSIVLQPLQVPATELLTVAPNQASTLCGRTLDWIELVGPSGS